MGNSPDVTARGWAHHSSHADHVRLRAGQLATVFLLQGEHHGRNQRLQAVDPVKVGVIADQTGPLSFVGLANANVARMVIGDINAKGGLLGRHVELYLEDSATNDAVAAAKAAKLVEQDHVDVIFGGIYSSTRQAIKGPAVVKGKTLYIYPEQYEGQESDPLIFCTGPVPAQQVDPFIPWLMQRDGREEVLPAVRRLHLAAHDEPEGSRGRHGHTAARSSARSNSRSTTRTTAATVEKIDSSGADVVFNTIVPPGVTPFFEQLHNSGFTSARRTPGLHVLRRELPEHGAGRPRGGPLQLPRLLPGGQRSVQPEAARPVRHALSRRRKFTGGGACSGLYRGLRLWAAAVTEAGSLTQADVIAALDHAEDR